ncbi:M1 family aminopeptidase [Calditrichota bacterium LG25]
MKLLHSFLWLGFLIAFCGAQHLAQDKRSIPSSYSASSAPATIEKFDAQYYRIEMQIDIPRRNVVGKTTLRLVSLQDNLQTVTLDFKTPLTVDSVGGAATAFARQDGLLTLTLNQSFNRGQQAEVWIAYSGNPQVPGSIAFVFDRMPDESPYVWTLSEPYGARQWWPCKDTPADKADSVDLIITVPQENLVASNGLLTEVRSDPPGWQTFHWQVRYPIATYLVSIVAGPLFRFTDYYHYSPVDSMLLDYYVFPDDKIIAQQKFTEMHDYLDALSHYFGPYPFLKEKYGQAQFGWGGGMEHQTITSIGRVSDAWTYLYVHELGHQWFGDMVTCASWHDIWLNEGFASYSEALYAEWAGYNGQPPGLDSYLDYMSTQLYYDAGTIYIEDTTSFAQLFSRIVYDKGSWVLHMLRKVIGEDNLFEAFKAYLNDARWTYGSVRTENFKEICEQISGVDLDAFFDQWLNYPYYPQYEYEWTPHSNVDQSYTVELIIRQTQQQTLYVMPIELRFLFADETDTTLTVQNNQFTQEYLFHFAKQPIYLQFDPDNWLLKESKETSPTTLITGYGFHKIFPNPSPGAVNIELIYWQREDYPVYVFDLLGKKIRTLLPNNRIFNLHQYFWDGKNDRGKAVSSGLYFLKAPTVAEGQTRKIMIIR